MRKAKTSNFILGYFLNLLLNLEWSIPAWILLGLHYALKIPISLFWIALALWLGGTFLFMLFLHLLEKCVPPDEPKENKNPYSVKNPAYLKKGSDENVK